MSAQLRKLSTSAALVRWRQGLDVVTPTIHTLTFARAHCRNGARDLKTRPGRLSPEIQTTCSFNRQETLRRVVLGQGRIQKRSPRDWPASTSPFSFHSHLRPGLAGSAWHAETSWAVDLARPRMHGMLPSKQIALLLPVTARTQHTVDYAHVPPLVQGSVAPTVIWLCPIPHQTWCVPACRP